MTYIPTKEELEELGFKSDVPGMHYFDISDKEKYLYVHLHTGEIGIAMNNEELSEELYIILYPRSISDLKTLIDIFTPKP